MPTRESIAKQRAAFLEKAYPEQVFTAGQWMIPAFILPREICPELPGFAMQMVADDASEDEISQYDKSATLFGVSEDVPPYARPFVVLHEFLEYARKMACCEAAALEMTAFWCAHDKDHTLLKQYLEMRRGLFDALPDYTTRHGYPPGKIEQFKRSLLFFRTWQATLG